MKLQTNNLISERQIERILSLVPEWDREAVNTMTIQVTANKAQRKYAVLEEGQRYGMMGCMGQFKHDKKEINIFLWPIWDASTRTYRYTSWEFGIWNELINTIYHEIGHAEDFAMSGEYRHSHAEQLWALNAKSDYHLGIQKKMPRFRMLSKVEQYAYDYAKTLQAAADLQGITIPEDLGIFNKLINDEIKNRLMWQSKYNWNWSSQLLFDKIRMHKFKLHHSAKSLGRLYGLTNDMMVTTDPVVRKKVLKIIETTKSKFEGETVLTKSGLHKTYYRHEEVLGQCAPKSALEELGLI